MSEDAQLVLLDYLTKRYASLKQSLTRLLGNADVASDALHDAWLRLKAKDDHGKVDNPGAYLTRMSVNIALNTHRQEGRLLTGEEAAQVMEIAADGAPGPERVAEARSELAALQLLLETMPLRRRRIAFLVHCEELEQRAVAKRLKISERTVAYELKHIHETVGAYLGRKKK